MQLSTLNQIKGKVTDIKKGVTTDHVRVDLGHGIVITSSITREALELLQLASGDDVIVVINESNIVIGK
jgi:molybdopterin-binding protein